MAVLDMQGTKLKDLQNANWQNIVKELTELFTKYYPAILNRVFVMNSPMFFDDVWEDMNDAVGADSTDYKNFIISANSTHPELTAQVESEKLPQVYGGETEFDLKQGLFNEIGPWSLDHKLTLIGEEENKMENDFGSDDDIDEGLGDFASDLKNAIQGIPSFPSGSIMKTNTKATADSDTMNAEFGVGIAAELSNQTPNATPMNTWVEEDD